MPRGDRETLTCYRKVEVWQREKVEYCFRLRDWSYFEGFSCVWGGELRPSICSVHSLLAPTAPIRWLQDPRLLQEWSVIFFLSLDDMLPEILWRGKTGFAESSEIDGKCFKAKVGEKKGWCDLIKKLREAKKKQKRSRRLRECRKINKKQNEKYITQHELNLVDF